MKVNLSKILLLLSIFLGSSAFGLESNPCCTPVTPDSIMNVLHPKHQGGAASNYTLRFNPSNQFKNQMQSYINYLHAMNPAINSINIHWHLGDAGTGPNPNPGYGGAIPGAGDTFTAWSAGGNGNVTNGGGNFWNGYPLQINHWYHVHTGTYLNDNQEFFSKKCANNGFFVNFVVRKSAQGGNGELKISDGRKIIKTIPVKLKNRKGMKAMIRKVK